jgi:hypothetical protein
MKAGKETAMYNQGYMDGYEDAEKAYVKPIMPKIKGGFSKDDPDYWTRLEHQYAGMAMQGILAHEGTEFRNYLPQEAKDIAHALVEKMKESV